MSRLTLAAPSISGMVVVVVEEVEVMVGVFLPRPLVFSSWLGTLKKPSLAV